jgi:predicted ATP-grasp superfamily ATP-dependent carboligase
MPGPDARLGALVTDAQERWSVAVCRSLHGAGFRVAAAADFTPGVAHWSRFCDVRLTVPDPHVDALRYALALEQALSGRGYSVLLACGDASVLAVSRHRELVEPHLAAPLGLAPHEVVVAASDKVRLLAAADAADLPCPPTAVCSTVDEALAAAAELGYPVVIKPRSSVYEVDGRVLRTASRRVDDADELSRVAGSFGDPCLIQRTEDGVVHSSSGVMADGRLLAFSLARYLRTWPPDAGNAAFAETIAPPEGLARRVEALIADLGWEGMFELELLRGANGSFASIDLNPRAYGSVALAIRAGADLPAIWARRLLGERPAYAVAQPGVRYRWEDAEVRRLVWELRRGRLAAAAGIALPRRNVVHPHFQWDDPGPLIARGAYFAGRALVRARQAAGERRR